VSSDIFTVVVFTNTLDLELREDREGKSFSVPALRPIEKKASYLYKSDSLVITAHGF